MDLKDRRAHGHEVADRVTEHDQAGVLSGHGTEAGDVDGLDGAGPGRPQDERRRGRRRPGPAGDEGEVGTIDLLDPVIEGTACLVCQQLRHRHGSHPVEEPVEVEQEQQQADGKAAARQAHADVRDGVRPDPADDGDGEHERADQLGQHELEPPIAIPQAHVAGREDARRLLHSEDGHGDHEAGQRDGGGDRGRHDGRGGLRRVLQHRQVTARVQPVDDLGEDEPAHASEQRHQPQAVLDVLTDAEADAPAHGCPLTGVMTSAPSERAGLAA